MAAKRDANGRFIKGSGSGGSGGSGGASSSGASAGGSSVGKLNVSIKVKTESEWKKVKKAAKKGSINSVVKAAAAIRLTASRSIRRSKRYAPPGKPPNTRRGQLRKAIRYEVDDENESAVIGPIESAVGQSGAAHEFGGAFRGDDYPERPFMGPALEKTTPRLPAFWQNSVRSN